MESWSMTIGLRVYNVLVAVYYDFPVFHRGTIRNRR